MARESALFHTPASLLAWRVTRWIMLGENVGYGWTVKQVHRAFMKSPTHRNHVLSDHYLHVGIAVAKPRARRWVTVIFESERDPGTRMEMPAC